MNTNAPLTNEEFIAMTDAMHAQALAHDEAHPPPAVPTVYHPLYNPDPGSPPEDSLGASPLAQLPREPHRAYSIFMQWVLADPPPAASDLRDVNNVSRGTITRWRRIYLWNERRRAFYHSRLLAVIGAKAAPPPPAEPAPAASPAPPPEPGSLAGFDLRAELLSLTRSALQRWREAAEAPVSIAHVTRLLELSLKQTASNDPRVQQGPPPSLTDAPIPDAPIPDAPIQRSNNATTPQCTAATTPDATLQGCNDSTTPAMSHN